MFIDIFLYKSYNNKMSNPETTKANSPENENEPSSTDDFNLRSALAGLAERAKQREPYSHETVKISLRSLLSLAEDLPPISTILYPGSAEDTSFADVMGGNVRHIDPDQKAIEVLSKAGYAGIPTTIEDYLAAHPGETVDMVISYNAGTVSEELAAAIRSGGYVIANNWHGSANDLGARDTEFEIVGAIQPGGTVDDILDPTAARDGLGSQKYAVTQEGSVIFDPAEIDKLDPETSTIISQERNTEHLWLFRKLAPSNS